MRANLLEGQTILEKMNTQSTLIFNRLIIKEFNMNKKHNKILSAVRREHADNYILTSLVAFAVTVIFTRVFLQVTGYPQLGNNILHIAHALWGGLFLIIAAFLPLAYANRWAIQASALLGGIGIGLFIDEVGKFITQANDYFYPPALPLIYGIILLNVFVYLYFRRPHKEDPRVALYHAFDRLLDVLDGDLDTLEADRIKDHLAIAKNSDRGEILTLVKTISDYFESEKEHLKAAEPDLWKRTARWVDSVSLRIGRRNHRIIISIILVGWVLFIIGYIITLILESPNLNPQVIQWRIPLIGIQVVNSALLLIALRYWLTNNEEIGLKFSVAGLLLSLVALQTFYFYITQFSAIAATLLQLAFLQILVIYRHLYFEQ